MNLGYISTREIYLEDTGEMLSLCSFSTPGSGEKVSFRCRSGNELDKEIYLCIDKNLQEKPFSNNDRIVTPVRGKERVFHGSHSAYAIVIDKSLHWLEPVILNTVSFELPFPMGHSALIKVTAEFTNIKVKCIQPEALARERVEFNEREPMEKIRGLIRSHLRKALEEHLQNVKSELQRPLDCINKIPPGGENIRTIVTESVYRACSWIKIESGSVFIRVENAEELISLHNKILEEELKWKQTVWTMMLEHFSRQSLAGGIGQIIDSWLKTRIDPTEEELEHFLNKLAQLNKQFGEDALIKMAKEIGCLKPAGGDSYVRGLL